MCTIQSVGAYKQDGRSSYKKKENPEKYLSKRKKCHQLAGLRAVTFFFWWHIKRTHAARRPQQQRRLGSVSFCPAYWSFRYTLDQPKKVKVNDNQSLGEKKNVPCFKKKKKDWVTICAQQRKEEKKEEEVEEAANEFCSPECWQEMESRYKKRERGRGRKWDISLKAGELDTGVAQNQNPQEQRATENIQTTDFRETPTSETCAAFCFINWYLIWSFHGRQKKKEKNFPGNRQEPRVESGRRRVPPEPQRQQLCVTPRGASGSANKDRSSAKWSWMGVLGPPGSLHQTGSVCVCLTTVRRSAACQHCAFVWCTIHVCAALEDWRTGEPVLHRVLKTGWEESKNQNHISANFCFLLLNVSKCPLKGLLRKI